MHQIFPGNAMRLLALSISFVFFMGCTTGPKLIPDTGPEIIDVYEEHTAATNELRREARPLFDGDSDLRGYTRTSTNEINQSFPRLPNPQLSIFVFGHLTAKGHPVPGYSSAFFMYDTTHYALPGEIPND